MSETQATAQLVKDLKVAATADDVDTLRVACERLIAHLPSNAGTIEPVLAREALGALRRNRRFGFMRRLAQAFIDDGCEDVRVIQHFAQALIEGGDTHLAIRLLEGLIADPTIAADDWAEAKAALGRAWKDRAVKARQLSRPGMAKRCIQQAFGHYMDAWCRDSANSYQGVNAIAIAAWDNGFALSQPDREAASGAAHSIVQSMESLPSEKLTNWDYATTGEALLGLHRFDEAVKWYAEYARREDSAFALAGTARQLIQLWNIGAHPDGESLLAPLLGKLGPMPGAGFSVSPQALESLAGVARTKHEALLGDAGALSYTWLQEGFARARAVALIHRSGRGHGTGFVVRGSDLDPALGDERLVVTNAHVVSNPPENNASHPNDATVTFELLEYGSTRMRHSVKDIVWQSPSNRHDVAILRLKPPVPGSIETLCLHHSLPPLNATPPECVYVIGHPGGREVSFSFQDNQLLDYEHAIYKDDASREPCRIHYRAPTEPGSSGSPVFDSSWRVIGVHHAGGRQVPMLNGRRDVYPANEGIWIETIRRAIAEEPARRSVESL